MPSTTLTNEEALNYFDETGDYSLDLHFRTKITKPFLKPTTLHLHLARAFNFASSKTTQARPFRISERIEEAVYGVHRNQEVWTKHLEIAEDQLVLAGLLKVSEKKI